MKTRFSTVDIVAVIKELQQYVGMRVNQVYDVDNKTYLFRLNRYEEKVVFIIESGMRIHTTEYQWPKNVSPSGFSMKMRKHIKNKRLESIKQLGKDRIVDLQFGINEAAYHVVLELYDKGNIVFTDYEYTILNILRPRASGDEDVKFIVREKYPIERFREPKFSFDRELIINGLSSAKSGDALKKILMPLVAFGPALLDHVLQKHGFPKNACLEKHFKVPRDLDQLFSSFEEADILMKEISEKCQGYIIQKIEKNIKDGKEIITNVEFHPYLFNQFKDMHYTVYDSFDKALDIYFSNMEGQKIDLNAFHKEKEALKKLENVKKDHQQRLVKLHESQAENIKKAQLIEMNLELVEKAILVIRSAIANQISWADIQEIIKEAQLEGDSVAKSIKKLKLEINHFTLLLSNPCLESASEEDEIKPQLVDIDLDYSAYANARKYYDMKRAHAKKEQRTIEASEKAFKNAEKKTKQALKEVAVITSITKARKVMWFEKFLWFISSENYLVLAGRDVQQNELLVKRYMKTNDLYVHADLHGASSVIIKNLQGTSVPPKTLNEAGVMAICNSSAWDAKIVTSAWWVYSNQVSKTAPSGEYLTAGSFMIRGKKNYLAPAHLVMGFGFMFKLAEESYENHVNERSDKSEGNVLEVEEEVAELADQSSDSECSDEQDESEGEMSSKHSEKAEENEDSSPEDFKKDISDSDYSQSESNSVIFPDTEVRLDVLSGAPKSDSSVSKANKGNVSGIIIQQHKKKVHIQTNKPQVSVLENQAKEKQSGPKRGQKGKLKKIKEKYKHQDEEERELRMKILASAGQAKENKKSKNKKSKETNSKQNNQSKYPKKNLQFIQVAGDGIVNSNILTEQEETVGTSEKKDQDHSNPVQKQDPEVLSDDEETNISSELQLLNSLTGCPIADDILLYAVPVCAPYNTMQSFKYKVKIIPGSSRRGKAAKTALQIFSHEKGATQRERDLLRGVKDQDISRNFPGKIKISTASFKKVK